MPIGIRLNANQSSGCYRAHAGAAESAGAASGVACGFACGTGAICGLPCGVGIGFGSAVGAGPVTLVAPLIATYPLVTVGLSAIFLSHVRITARLVAGVVMTVAGVVLMMVFSLAEEA